MPELNQWYVIHFTNSIPHDLFGGGDLVRFNPPVDVVEAKRIMVEEKGWTPHIRMRGLDDEPDETPS